MRQILQAVFITVTTAGMTLHGGRSASKADLISFLNVGNPTLTEYNCQNAPVEVWGGTDSKSWPAVGGYACPSGPTASTSVTANPLVASGSIACLAYIRFCAPTFGDPGWSFQFQGGSIASIGRYVEVTERNPSTTGCENASTATFETRTDAVFDDDARCNVQPDCHACVSPASGPNNCSEDGGMFDEACQCCVNLWEPIIIDIAGDGFQLTSRSAGVFFDIDGDGAPDLIPWTTAGGNDVWLTLDRNGNGLVDNGRELFGNFTAQPASADKNGFLALAVFDGFDAGGTGDGSIDAGDAVFSQLRFWRDENHDGISQSTELRSLAAAGVSRLSLDYKEAKWVDAFGNWFRYRARVIDARGRDIGKWAYDVYLSGKPPAKPGARR